VCSPILSILITFFFFFCSSSFRFSSLCSPALSPPPLLFLLAMIDSFAKITAHTGWMSNRLRRWQVITVCMMVIGYFSFILTLACVDVGSPALLDDPRVQVDSGRDVGVLLAAANLAHLLGKVFVLCLTSASHVLFYSSSLFVCFRYFFSFSDG